MTREDKEKFLTQYIIQIRDKMFLIYTPQFIEVADIIKQKKESKNKIVFLGNGASSSISNHFASDLMNFTGIKCLSISDSTLLTAMSNDFGFENSFERYCQLMLDPKDVLICISSSGESKNVIRAAQYAKKIDATVITFTGFKMGNTLSTLGDFNFWCDSNIYNMVENSHSTWLGMLTDLVTEEYRQTNDIGSHGIIL